MTDVKHDKARILIIDDEPFFLKLLTQSLSEFFHISLAKNGQQGLTRAQGSARPDLILLDVMMPDMDGYDTCLALKNNSVSREIPVIFLTAKHDQKDELKGFKMGAVDYITKPISIPILLTRIRTQLTVSQQRIALEQLVQDRTKDIEHTKDAMIYCLAEMAEARGKETGDHLLRVQQYIYILAKQMALNPGYEKLLTSHMINLIQSAAPLHDIGKIEIPEHILQNYDKLEKKEQEIFNQHPFLGKKAIETAEHTMGSSLFIQIAKEITWCHHEKWDGSGYPQGLSGDKIPLSARLMTLVDLYDERTSQCDFKPPMTHKESMQQIISERGKYFDPDVVDAFLEVHETFRSISE